MPESVSCLRKPVMFPPMPTTLTITQAQFRAVYPPHTHTHTRGGSSETKPPMPFYPSRVKVNLHAQCSRWPRQLCPQLHQQGSRGSLSTRNKFATPLMGEGRASTALGLNPCFPDSSALATHTGSPLPALSEPRLISISLTLCLCPSQKGSYFSLLHSSPKGSVQPFLCLHLLIFPKV